MSHIISHIIPHIMWRLILCILFFINCQSWDPKLYPYNPKIHNFGNNGPMGHIHSLIAPGFTMYTEKILYDCDVRDEILNKVDSKKTILDVGCGTGFSTSSNEGSLGIDTSNEMLKTAQLIFPKKNFSFSHIEEWDINDKFDIVTIMFMFHEVPQESRLNIINLIKKIASEQIIIVDIAPSYIPSKLMLTGEPYICDYLKNICDDLKDFKEEIIVSKHVHAWSFLTKK